MLEVSEKYSNPIYLVKIMPIGFADKLDEGWEIKRRDKDDSKVFTKNQTWFVPFPKREDLGRSRFEARARVACKMPLSCSDGSTQLDVRVRRAGERTGLIESIWEESAKR